MANLKFLLGLDFFRKWDGPDIEFLNRDFEIMEYRPNDVIYNAKEESTTFFIVKSGLFYMDSVVEIEQVIRYPTGPK